MESAVAELVDRPQVERAEGLELADPRHVEERVAVERRRDPPERDTEGDAERNDRPDPVRGSPERI